MECLRLENSSQHNDFYLLM